MIKVKFIKQQFMVNLIDTIVRSPNLIFLVDAQRIPIILANAVFSDKYYPWPYIIV